MNDNGATPATKADLIALEKRLTNSTKADLTALEERLTNSTKADLTALEERLNRRMEASEERLNERMQATEERLTENFRDMQTELLKAIYAFAESNQKRLTDVERDSAGLKERMAMMEARLMQVEKRLNMPPGA